MRTFLGDVKAGGCLVSTYLVGRVGKENSDFRYRSNTSHDLAFWGT